MHGAYATHEEVATEADYRTLKQEQRPPAHVRVNLAAQDNPGLFALRRVFVAGFQKGDNSLHRAAATTFVLGHLVVQVVMNPDTSYRAYATGGMRKARVQSIVPPIPSGAVWPQPLLTGSELHAFGEASVAPTNRLDPSTYRRRDA